MYFCVAKRKTTEIMVATQPTFNQVYDMACMLSRTEQRRLVNRIVGVLLEDEDGFLRQRREHVSESEQQIVEGKVYSEEESDKMIEDIFNELSIIAA